MKYNIKIVLLVTAVSIIGIAATVTLNKTERKLTFKNVLILGNSITRHSPAPKLGWYGDWGMAATSKDKDFVHILEKNLRKFINLSQYILEL